MSKKVYTIITLIFLLLSCVKEYPSPFPNGTNGEFKISMKLPQDNLGYYHYTFDTTKFYDYTSIFAEASSITNERYLYNGISVAEGKFDSNSFWLLGDSLTVVIPLYNPFSNLYTSPYFTSPLATKTKKITLSQFKNFIVPLVPTTSIYFKAYDPRMDEYIPKPGNIWSKRIIGPIPKSMIGDTITIYGRITWDAGNYSIKYPDRTTKKDSLILIIQK